MSDDALLFVICCHYVDNTNAKLSPLAEKVENYFKIAKKSEIIMVTVCFASNFHFKHTAPITER